MSACTSVASAVGCWVVASLTPSSLPAHLNIPPWVEAVQLCHYLKHSTLYFVIAARFVPARPTAPNGVHLEGRREGGREGEVGTHTQVGVVALCLT